MCFCLDGSPIEDDDKGKATLQVGLCGACCAEPATCLCTAVPLTAPCMVYFIRKEALGGDSLEGYKCCQGYYNCCCCTGGKCCESLAGSSSTS